MYQVSDKLKLCTCNSDIDKIENYWVFYRFIDGKDERVVGEWMLPASASASDEKFNRRLLLKLLNEGNVFDVEINQKQNDLLQLSFRPQPDGLTLTYGFVYRKGKWVAKEFDPLEWMWRHEEEKEGEIVNALQTRTKLSTFPF